jgi:hypothetical protein
MVKIKALIFNLNTTSTSRTITKHIDRKQAVHHIMYTGGKEEVHSIGVRKDIALYE